MTTNDRRYGQRHRDLRQQFAPLVLSGEVACVRCGDPILPGQHWHLGHRDGDPTAYAGPEHATCNMRAGRWRQLIDEEPPPEREGIPLDDPRWRVPWLTPLLKVPPDATWPRLMTVPHPRAVASLGPGFERFARRRSGRSLRWWQRLVARRLLEVDAAGELCWGVLVLSLARQLGKSWFLRELIWWRIHQRERFGEPQDVLHTGKDLAICKEVQREHRIYAKARRADYKVREVNGQEEIELLEDGSRWLIRAKESVYGYSVSAAAVDEAWKVDASALEEGLTPTMVERAQSQLWLVSTAHRRATSLMLERRALALEELDSGAGGDLLIEWSAPREAELSDLDAWRAASPHWSVGREADIARRLEQAHSGELRSEDEPDPVETFRAQWLNQWPQRRHVAPGKVEDLLPEGLWAALEAELEPSLEPVFVALEDDYGQGAAVAAACWLEDGRIEVDGWVRGDWDSAIVDLQRLSALRPIRELHVGASLLDRLEGAGLPRARPVTNTQTAPALALLRDLAAGGMLVHEATPDLDAALRRAQVREQAGGLVLASQGPRALVKALVWVLQAAHRPSRVPAIY